MNENTQHKLINHLPQDPISHPLQSPQPYQKTSQIINFGGDAQIKIMAVITTLEPGNHITLQML